MSKLVYLPNDNVLREQAGVWLAKLDRGLRAEEHDELRRWLQQNTLHKTALFQVAELWDRMDVLTEIAQIVPLEERAPPHLRRYAWSAAVLLTIFAAIGFVSASNGIAHLHATVANLFMSESLDLVYQTAIGEQKTVQLPDHSTVELNTNTKLHVLYTETERKLELLRGEAHFKVTKDAYRVFTVKVSRNEFKAVGTAFNIRMDSMRGIELTVTEGRVKVIAPFAADTVRLDKGAMATPSMTEIMVDAGKEVAIDQATQTIERLQPEEIEAALAWQHGMLMFDGEPLARVIQELSRYSNVKIQIADNELRDTAVTGYFKIGDIDGLIAALHANFNINAHRDDETILLSFN